MKRDWIKRDWVKIERILVGFCMILLGAMVFFLTLLIDGEKEDLVWGIVVFILGIAVIIFTKKLN